MSNDSDPQRRRPTPFQKATALYGLAFEPAARAEVNASMRDFMHATNPTDRSFMMCHLLYLNLQAQSQLWRTLLGIRETLQHIAGATHTITDEVTRPRLEAELAAQQAEQALEGQLARLSDLHTEMGAALDPLPFAQAGDGPRDSGGSPIETVVEEVFRVPVPTEQASPGDSDAGNLAVAQKSNAGNLAVAQKFDAGELAMAREADARNRVVAVLPQPLAGTDGDGLKAPSENQSSTTTKARSARRRSTSSTKSVPRTKRSPRTSQPTQDEGAEHASE